MNIDVIIKKVISKNNKELTASYQRPVYQNDYKNMNHAVQKNNLYKNQINEKTPINIKKVMTDIDLNGSDKNGNKRLHGKWEIVDRVIGIVDIAFGIKDVLKDIGILPDNQSEDFEKIVDAIGKNYAAINEVGNKVDRNFAAMRAIFEVTSKTLSSIEETRIEMRQGFKRVLESIQELKVEDKVSSLTIFMDDFIKDAQMINELPANVRVTELERPNGVLNQVKKALSTDGILYSNLYHIINEDLAIPRDANDNVAFVTFTVLYYGVQSYVTAVFFTLDQYSFLADHYYQTGNIYKCNEYFDYLEIDFKHYKRNLLNNNEQLIHKMIHIINRIQELTFVRNERQDIFIQLPNRIDSLNVIIQKLNEMQLPIIIDSPDIIMRSPDFTNSKIKTPILEWIDGAQVSYAIQYMDTKNNMYSKIGEWSDPFTIDGKANPFLRKIPVIPSLHRRDRTRLIFRKFNNNQPQLVGVIQDMYQIDFRDINRDFYNVAGLSRTTRNEAEILLENGADINETFENGRRAIHAAAQRGHCKIAIDFLFKTTDINVKDIDGYTSMYIAAEAGYEDFVELLIQNGADVNIKSHFNHFTPLHICTYKGDVSTVQVLMKSDQIDVNAPDRMGFAPIHNAVFGGIYVLNTLLSHNNTNINAKSNEGLTPLHVASINDFDDVVQVLLKHDTLDIHQLANGNLTALHFAAALGNLNVVNVLITQTNIDINAKSTDGWTPLHYACFLKKETIAVELLKIKNIEVNVKGKHNMTPLHVATITGQQNLTLSLLKMGALTEEPTTDGFTALHLAAAHNKYDIIPILIDNNANIDARTSNSESTTPLNLAASLGSQESVVVLLNRGADTKMYDMTTGQAPVHNAVIHGHVDILYLLVKHDSNLIYLNNQNSESILHLAAQKGYLDIIRYLVEDQEMYVRVRNQEDDSPLHYAAKYGHLDVVDYFLNDTRIHMFVHNNTYLLGNRFDETPLDFAIQSGQLDVVKHFINDKKINDFNKCYQLAFAIQSDNLDLVKYVLDIQKVRLNDFSILFTARHGSLNIMKYFVNEKNIDVTAKYFEANNLTPLHYASLSNNLELVKYLVDEKNTDVNIRGECVGLCFYSKLPLHYAALSGNLDLVKYFVDEKYVDMNSPVEPPFLFPIYLLQFACLSGNLNLVKYLVEEKHANIHIRTFSSFNFDISPLSLAFASNHLDLIKYFVDEMNVSMNGSCNIMPNEKIHSLPAPDVLDVYSKNIENVYGMFLYRPNSRGYYYLDCAAANGNLEMIKYLVEDKNFDINETRTNTKTIPEPLYYAAQYGYLDIVKYLTHHNADVSRKNYDGNTPLNGAAQFGRVDVVKYLVGDMKVDMNVKDSLDRTPLHAAAANSYLDIVKYLTESGANLNAKDIRDGTPLLLAASNGHLDVVKYLVEKGADINAKDMFDCTPLGKAIVNNQLDVVKYLESQGALSNSCSSKSAEALFDYGRRFPQERQNEKSPTSAGSRPSSWIHTFTHVVINSVVTISTLISSRFKLATDMKQCHKTMPIQETDINSTLLLLDVFTRKCTGRKYVCIEDRIVTLLEARAYALNIVEEFEEVVLRGAHDYKISLNRLNIDFIGMQKEIVGKIMSGELNQIVGVLKLYVKQACSNEFGLKFDNFMKTVNSRIDDALLDKSMHQLLHNRTGRTFEVNDAYKHQMMESNSYLNNTSVQDYLSGINSPYLSELN